MPELSKDCPTSGCGGATEHGGLCDRCEEAAESIDWEEIEELVEWMQEHVDLLSFDDKRSEFIVTWRDDAGALCFASASHWVDAVKKAMKGEGR